MNTTPLSYLLDEMHRYRDIENLEQQLKVRAINGQIRETRRNTVFPWTLKKGTLRVFADVLEYPIASDHDEIAYIDKQMIESYASTARLWNTSIEQFYEQVNSTRNLMAEIWKDGNKMIGLNMQREDLSLIKLNNADDEDLFTLSDDASGASVDNVVYKKGTSSIKFTITNATDLATVKNTFTQLSDSDYKSKYHFRYIYLPSVPTSIEMRLQTDDDNYLSTVVTTQFSGEAFKANDWNLIAHDLNEATGTGTFNSDTIASEKLIFVGASTGTYRVDESSIRKWMLMDYWYYSIYNVMSNGSSTPDKQYFIEVTETNTDIDLEDVLIGDTEWIDYIIYGAMNDLTAEIENEKLQSNIKEKYLIARDNFLSKYPNIVPLITTNRHRFNNDPLLTNLNNYVD